MGEGGLLGVTLNGVVAFEMGGLNPFTDYGNCWLQFWSNRTTGYSKKVVKGRKIKTTLVLLGLHWLVPTISQWVELVKWISQFLPTNHLSAIRSGICQFSCIAWRYLYTIHGYYTAYLRKAVPSLKMYNQLQTLLKSTPKWLKGL